LALLPSAGIGAEQRAREWTLVIWQAWARQRSSSKAFTQCTGCVTWLPMHRCVHSAHARGPEAAAIMQALRRAAAPALCFNLAARCSGRGAGPHRRLSPTLPYAHRRLSSAGFMYSVWNAPATARRTVLRAWRKQPPAASTARGGGAHAGLRDQGAPQPRTTPDGLCASRRAVRTKPLVAAMCYGLAHLVHVRLQGQHTGPGGRQ